MALLLCNITMDLHGVPSGLNSKKTPLSLAKPIRIVSVSSASTDTLNDLGIVTTPYGAFLLALRIDAASDGAWFGFARHNAAGWQITEIYKGSDSRTPYFDSSGAIKTASTSAITVHGFLLVLSTWN